MQLQLVTEDDRAGECMFWGQLSSSPSTQYLPGLQGWHPEKPLPLVPLRHRQKSAEGLTGGLCCAAPAGHDSLWPMPRQKLSEGQGWHMLLSVCTVAL